MTSKTLLRMDGISVYVECRLRVAATTTRKDGKDGEGQDRTRLDTQTQHTCGFIMV